MQKEITVNAQQLMSMHQNQKNQLNGLLQQINSMQSLLQENVMAKEALKTLDAPGKDEILFSLGAGIFIDATVDDLKKIKANIGGNIFEEMNVKKAVNKLDDRIKSVEKNITNLREQEQSMSQNLMELEKAINLFEQKRRQVVQAPDKTKQEETNPDVS